MSSARSSRGSGSYFSSVILYIMFRKLPGVREVVVRIDVRLALRVPVGERGERRHLRDQPDRLDVAVLRVLDLVGVRVERRQRADRAEQHPHRVRVVAEALA